MEVNTGKLKQKIQIKEGQQRWDTEEHLKDVLTRPH
jgi:hypothetical protein